MAEKWQSRSFLPYWNISVSCWKVSMCFSFFSLFLFTSFFLLFSSPFLLLVTFAVTRVRNFHEKRCHGDKTSGEKYLTARAPRILGLSSVWNLARHIKQRGKIANRVDSREPGFFRPSSFAERETMQSLFAGGASDKVISLSCVWIHALETENFAGKE